VVNEKSLMDQETLALADSTSIVRRRRLPIPADRLRALGWTEGQPLWFTRSNDDVIVRAEGPGQPIVLSPAGLVWPVENLGLTPGQILAWEPHSGGLRISAVDGLAHESYRNPKTDRFGVPVPPSWLTQAFTGKPNSGNYLERGESVVESLAELAAAAGRDLASLDGILDFGCGAGRMLRYMPKPTRAGLVGYDLHAPSIDWCRAHMPFGRWEHGRQTPPLDESDDSFDLIYAISVLTHLDEAHQDLWLSEWKRLLRPGGILIATYRSELFAEKIIKPRDARYAESVLTNLKEHGGFVYITDGGWSGIFPGYYNDAYHAQDYVNRRWGEIFEIVRIYPSGTLFNQDIALLRKS
jgi:SAM-dependent methyltransferase